MKRVVVVAAALSALLGLVESAQARPWWSAYEDPRVAAADTAVNLGATATFLSLNKWSFRGDFNSTRAGGLTTGSASVLTSFGCAAIAPMVATVVVQRPLTMREGHTMIAGCFIPIIGGLLVSAAYDAHPEWEGVAAAPVSPRKTVRR